MIQSECAKCRNYSEAISHGDPCPWCNHDSSLNSKPWKVAKVIIVLASAGLAGAVVRLLLP